MNYRDTWDLSTIPLEALKSEWARRSRAKQKSPPNHKPWPCKHCHAVLNARERRKPCPYCGKRQTETVTAVEGDY